MAAPYLILNQPQVAVGLGTYTYTVTTAGNYNIQVGFTENPPSSLSVVVNKNGSPIYTMPTVSPTQIAEQGKVSFTAAVNDSITVVISSSAAIDNQYNTVKSVIIIGQGF